MEEGKVSNQAILRKLKKLEKVFVGPGGDILIVEMWRPHQDDPEKVREMVEHAVQEIHQGNKSIVLIPHGGLERFEE